MKLFGFEITRRRKQAPQGLQSVWPQPWFGPILEPWTGAWQCNVTVDPQQTLLSFSALFAVVTGIASDIAKCRIKLSKNVDGIWEEITENSPFLPVLRKPNDYQNRIQFVEHWIMSKLLSGNTYVLLERDNRGGESRGVVRKMFVLDPRRVKVLVAPDGSVYYELQSDNLSTLEDHITVPASEIIHDRMTPLFHPLIGVSPIYACGVSATMGNKIQANSTNLFGNRSMPGGMLTAPGRISQETADRMKKKFDLRFGGENYGSVLIAGEGMKFEPFAMTAENSQLIDQLEWTVQDVGRAFHYPAFKMGGPVPPYAGNIQALNLGYYTDCLQEKIESLELCLDEGLGLPVGIGTEVDTDNLMRMDTAALFESNSKAVGGGWMSPNEARTRYNLPAVTGGDSPLIQQQNYSLEALAKRDAKEDPFASKSPSPPPQEPPPQTEPQRALNPSAIEERIATFRRRIAA